MLTKLEADRVGGPATEESISPQLYPTAERMELWPVDKLVPYARNPRTHSDTQVAQIAASIAEFGFNNPILVDTKAGIIAGHGRVLAARKLQLAEVPVIVLGPSHRDAEASIYPSRQPASDECGLG